MGHYAIRKRFRFEAAHWLAGLPQGHQCNRLHGHSYQVEIECRAHGLGKVGFVQDFADLNVVGRFLAINFDHQVLNEVVQCNPTAENLAKVIWDECKGALPLMRAVTVWETADSWASYTEDPDGV